MRLTKVFTTCAALTALLATAAFTTSAPARAADDDEPSIDQKVMRSIMEGLGLRRDGEEGITYRERAPLVIPSSRDLPPPDTGDAAATNPAWPKDPDVERRKLEGFNYKYTTVLDEEERARAILHGRGKKRRR